MNTFKSKDNCEKLILAHRYLYYVLGNPVLSDQKYDKLEKKFLKLYPDSEVIKTCGSDLSSDYSEEIIIMANDILKNKE